MESRFDDGSSVAVSDIQDMVQSVPGDVQVDKRIARFKDDVVHKWTEEGELDLRELLMDRTEREGADPLDAIRALALDDIETAFVLTLELTAKVHSLCEKLEEEERQHSLEAFRAKDLESSLLKLQSEMAQRDAKWKERYHEAIEEIEEKDQQLMNSARRTQET
ncbi:MAG: uncharacterized protein KVP18_002415, partial [Porospora cf. gigantea A]|uniref:uncharacterized protein n=1 Tax=Porospora cf. gigantea A TaxID=2853593 RepID=UPI00355A471B